MHWQSQCVLGSTPASAQVCQINRKLTLLCQWVQDSCVSTVLTTTYGAGGSTVTEHYSRDRMAFGTAQYGMWSILLWALGQGPSCLFIPDCEDMLGGGGDALRGLNFAFLRITLLLSLCPAGFHRITADFSFLPAAWAGAASLPHWLTWLLFYSTSYLFSLYLCKSWTGVWTFSFLLDKAIKTALFPSWWKRA